MRASRSVLWALSLAMGGGGCSAIFVNPPAPRGSDEEAHDCTRTTLPALADSAVASIAAADALVFLGEEHDPAKPTVVAVASATMIGFAASAIYGFVKTHECRVASRGKDQGLSEKLRNRWRPPAPGVDEWLSAGPPPGAFGLATPALAPASPPPPPGPSPAGEGVVVPLDVNVRP